MSPTHAQDVAHGRGGGRTLPPENRDQRAAREARLVAGYCVCWGLVGLVDWEIGSTCSRCGDTFITEAEYLERRTAGDVLRPVKTRPKGQRTSIVRHGKLRSTETVATGGLL